MLCPECGDKELFAYHSGVECLECGHTILTKDLPAEEEAASEQLSVEDTLRKRVDQLERFIQESMAEACEDPDWIREFRIKGKIVILDLPPAY